MSVVKKVGVDRIAPAFGWMERGQASSMEKM